VSGYRRITEVQHTDNPNAPVKIIRGGEEGKSVSNLLRLLAGNTFDLFQPDSYEGYVWKHNTHVWVYCCIRVLVDAATRVEPLQYREYVQGGVLKQEPLPYDHPAVTILQNPNLDDTIADLIEKIIVSWNLAGIYYLAYEPTVHELWHLRSDRVTINPDPKTFIKDFTYEIGGQKTTFPRDAIIYDKFYNPNNDYYGLSPLQAAKNSINSHMRAQKWNLHYFENSAIPAGLLESDYHFENQDQLDLYKKQWQELYGGYKKAGSIAVVGDGLEYKPITPTHTDMGYSDLLATSRDEIFSAFGVPKIYANAAEAENYSNLKEYERMLWRRKMIPMLIKVEQTFNKYLNQRFATRGEFIRTKFDLSQVEALHDDILKEAEAARVLGTCGQLKINEARQRRGDPPVPWGDTSLVPMSLVRGDQIGEIIEGKIPATNETPKKTVFKSILKSHEERFRHWAKTKAIVGDNERKMIRVLTAIFTDWQEEILAKLGVRKALEEKIKALEEKTIDVDSILFDVEGAKVMLERAGGPLLEDSIAKGGKRVLSSINSSVSFDLHDPRVEELLQAAKQRFKNEIAEGHWLRMKDSLSEGIRDGESSQQLAQRVRDTMGHEINNAPTVARSEINPRYQEGQREGMRQSGVVKKKEWLSAFSESSRDEHLAADGQQVGLDDSFEVGGEPLQYPGDPSGSASNIINCICDMLAVLEED